MSLWKTSQADVMQMFSRLRLNKLSRLHVHAFQGRGCVENLVLWTYSKYHSTFMQSSSRVWQNAQGALASFFLFLFLFAVWFHLEETHFCSAVFTLPFSIASGFCILLAEYKSSSVGGIIITNSITPDWVSHEVKGLNRTAAHDHHSVKLMKHISSSLILICHLARTSCILMVLHLLIRISMINDVNCIFSP